MIIIKSFSRWMLPAQPSVCQLSLHLDYSAQGIPRNHQVLTGLPGRSACALGAKGKDEDQGVLPSRSPQTSREEGASTNPHEFKNLEIELPYDLCSLKMNCYWGRKEDKKNLGPVKETKV